MHKILFISLALLSFSSFSQDMERRNIYYGNVAYDNENYVDAVSYYEEALIASPLSYKAHYNMANAYFRQKDFQKAADLYTSIIDLAPTAFDKSKVYHNLGNSHFLNQKLDEAIDAYKSALRLNPTDEDTRYNLAYALLLKQQQPPQENKNENQNENDEQNQNDKQNQNNSDKQNQNDKQDEKDKQNDDKNEKDKQNQNDKQNESDKQNEKDGTNKSQPNKMSKEEIRRILDAAYRREKEIQGKIEKQKIVGEGTSSKKDW